MNILENALIILLFGSATAVAAKQHESREKIAGRRHNRTFKERMPCGLPS